MTTPNTQHPAPDFYIGYQPSAPIALARFIRRLIVIGVSLALALAVAIAVAQSGYAPATFEFGVPRELIGRIRGTPYPMLELSRPGAGVGSSISRYLLAGAGKHGAEPLVRDLENQLVRVSGELIYRDNLVMVQLARMTPVPGRAGAPAPNSPRELGRVTPAGGIVDGKCYLGVMNPGQGKTHRSCAARCLSGGLPPLFLARDRAGAEARLVLLSAAGLPLARQVAPLAGQPLRITGRVFQEGGFFFLRADPDAFSRVR